MLFYSIPAATVSAPTTGAALRQDAIAQQGSRFLATGIPTVDAALRGGLCAGTITEVTGESSRRRTPHTSLSVLDIYSGVHRSTRSLYIYTDLNSCPPEE